MTSSPEPTSRTLPLPRLVLVEEAALAGSASSVMEMARGIGVRVVPRLAALDEEVLTRADGEVFLRRELQGAEGAFYRGRIHGPVRRKMVQGNVLWQRGADGSRFRQDPDALLILAEA